MCPTAFPGTQGGHEGEEGALRKVSAEQSHKSWGTLCRFQLFRVQLLTLTGADIGKKEK